MTGQLFDCTLHIWPSWENDKRRANVERKPKEALFASSLEGDTESMEKKLLRPKLNFLINFLKKEEKVWQKSYTERHLDHTVLSVKRGGSIVLWGCFSKARLTKLDKVNGDERRTISQTQANPERKPDRSREKWLGKRLSF